MSKDLSFSLPGLKLTIGLRNTLTITGPDDTTVLEVQVGKEFPFKGTVRKCTDEKSDNTVCVKWEGEVKLEMKYREDGPAKCYDIRWFPQTKDYVPYDCFDVSNAHWYGGAERHGDRWPIQEQATSMIEYLGCDAGMVTSGYGSVIERYWFSSKGVALFVEDEVPLHVGIDAKQLCLKADYENSWYQQPNGGTLPDLKYTICVAEDVKEIHKYMTGKHFQKPIGIPDERVLREPIWSTWAQYHTKITQNKTLDYAHYIHKYGFPAAQIEIDDMYTPKYGDFTFNTEKFPNSEAMSKDIHDNLNYKITSWVIPFANTDSEAFQEGIQKGYWVKDATGEAPRLLKWWQGIAVLLDFTNPEAVEWFFQRLENFKKQGVDSFKFDAGEINFLAPHFTTFKPLPNPNHFSKYYAEAIHAHSDGIIELRVGYKTQHLPVLVRMMDKDSHWGYGRGFKSMIPSALLFSVLGYPFILPDMIGGNAYNDQGTTGKGLIYPDKELFIRWLQLNVFLPSIQFSIPPWSYDEETINITHKMLKLRDTYAVPKILSLAHESTETGDPIIRPLWWISPKDPNTHADDSEFLLGDDVLIAPVLEEKARARDIYLPRGTWQDMLRGEKIVGPKTLKDFKVDLDEIAYFERIQSK